MKNDIQTGANGCSSDKRKRILSTTFDLICQKGLSHVSVTDIAEAADVSVGTLYNYYPGKKEIFLAAYTMWNEEGMDYISQIWQEIDTPFALRRIIEETLDSTVQGHLFSKRVHDEFWSLIYSDEEFMKTYNKCMLQSVDTIMPILIKLGFKVPYIREKIHFVMNIVELYSHEVAYNNSGELEYDQIRGLIVELIVQIILKVHS